MKNKEKHQDVLARFQGVTQVVADSLRFKRKLSIGEDAYTSLKIGRTLAKVWDVGGVAATGAGVAASTTVAGTLFAPTGFMAAIGLGAAAATPIGWIVAAAVVSGSAYYGVTRAVGSYAKSRVEVIPKFINSPIDQLGAALLDMMGALALKVATIDGVIDPAERIAMRNYFCAEWGYDPEYVTRALELIELNIHAISIKSMTLAITNFIKQNPDCNPAAFRVEMASFLGEIAESDGTLDEREELAIDAIIAALKA